MYRALAGSRLLALTLEDFGLLSLPRPAAKNGAKQPPEPTSAQTRSSPGTAKKPLKPR
jgi:hypothetical protein